MRIKTTYRKEKKCPVEVKIEEPSPANDEVIERQDEEMIEIDSNYRKRSILTECIDEIYLMSGMNLPELQPAINGKKSDISRNINLLIKSETSTSLEHNKMISARRQLFREQRTNLRKQRKQKCRKLMNLSTSVQDYRSIRHLLRNNNVRRNVLNNGPNKIWRVKNFTNYEMRNICAAANTTIDSESTDDASEVEPEEEEEAYDSDFDINGYYSDEDDPSEQEEEAALARTRIWAEEQYHIAIETHNKMMEETLRTVYYLKTLCAIEI